MARHDSDNPTVPRPRSVESILEQHRHPLLGAHPHTAPPQALPERLRRLAQRPVVPPPQGVSR